MLFFHSIIDREDVIFEGRDFREIERKKLLTLYDILSSSSSFITRESNSHGGTYM